MQSSLVARFSLLRIGGLRSFQSRAHPRPPPEFGVWQALDTVLDDIERRRTKRDKKWIKNAPQRASKGITDTDCKHPDETIELALNLNLDPRKPGQALRGSVSLPHGTGKRLSCVVFTSDESIQQQALEAGALHAGGDELVDQIVDGTVSVDEFSRALGTPEVMPILSRKVARVLGPRGLMPNAKSGTLLAPELLLEALETQLAGREAAYRTDRAGIVHIPVGKGSFGAQKLVENVGQIMKVIFEVKPESYGKSKGKKQKVAKNAKYLLKASVCSTQGPGVRLDLKTVDPSSPFFLATEEENENESEAA